jgi:DNA invertase Pin-like site-specific DNA recombinase
MPKAKNVTVIPATLNMHTKTSAAESSKRRVAGYARVSTDSDEQFTSYEAQVDYYTNFIKENPAWEFVGIYTDEGISGVNTKRREGFNSMIQDALDGKIDLIVTKSVSRFARNTVDSLTTIRKLKEAGCECLFQKENIMTFDSKGELLITIMSSLAQEESRSISENVTWGQRKRFSDGKVSIPYGQFLGYRKGADGLPEVVPEEAEIVRSIYRLFIQGKSTNAIAKLLTAEGIPTPGGKTQWQRATVESILSNEKYKGSALLQKSFTVDFLTKKTKVNEGEVPQYYVEESHPAIIDPDEWNEVQAELAKRKNSGKRHRQTSPFSGKIFCGDCGEIYGSKVWHSTDKYRRVIWQCNAKFKGENKCETPHLYEDQLRGLFIDAMSDYLSDHESTIKELQYAQRSLTDTDFIDEDIRTLEHELEITSEMVRVCINSNASNTITETEYRTKHSELCSRFMETENRLNALKQRREQMKNDAIAIGGMLFELSELDGLPITFNEKLWTAAIDRVMVYADCRVVFHFKDGKDIAERL